VSAASGSGWQALARGAALRAAEPAGLAREFLCFELAGAPYALPVGELREIARLRALTPLPRAALDVLGIASLRGQVICVIDLRRRLGLPAEPPGRSARLAIVSDPERGLCGLLVDRVCGVQRSDASQLRPAGAAGGRAVAGLLARGGGFATLLDLARVLDREA